MQCEMDALLRNHELISLPKGKKTVDYKWVFNINFLADGIRERYKAWLVTKGFTQIPSRTVGLHSKMNFSLSAYSLATSYSWPL